MRRAALPLAALALALACVGSPDGADPVDARAARLERQLLASCSCHPKQIAGLEVERDIRAAIRAGIAAGHDDGDILWSVLQAHGTELLTAGVADVERRADAVLVATPAVFLLGAAALLLQLRRRT